MSHILDLDFHSRERQETIRQKCYHSSLHYVPFDIKEVEQSISERLDYQVQQFPHRIAIHTEEESLTYCDLKEACTRVAGALSQRNCSKAQPVATLFSQSVNAITGILGVLKSANFYVPLDPSLPFERLKFMVKDSEAQIILTDTQHLALAETLHEKRLKIHNIDDMNCGPHTELQFPPPSPDSLAWIIYTSGSTGRPKGVMQTHRNVLHFMMNYINNFHLCHEDRLSLLFPCSVHAGSYAALLPLMVGAGAFSLDLKVNNSLDQLSQWLAQRTITIYCSVPTVFRQWTRSLSGEENFPNLRLIYLAGEPVLKGDAALYQKHFSTDCLFVNRLGSTETDCYALFFMDHTTKISTATVPVGYPVEDQEILILDEERKEVLGDACGEIVVRSGYLSPGYWKRPDLTDRAFVSSQEPDGVRLYYTGDMAQRSSNGCIVHQGRKDFQVKIRGHRVEVSEIEIALLEIGTLKEVVVVAQQNKVGDCQLVAYVVPFLQPGPSCAELRAGLTTCLPDYMIPSGFVQLEKLPRALNGKLFRRGLPEYSFEHPALSSVFAPPGTFIEKSLVEIWGMVLEIDQVGIDDVFFELGGHSLHATRIASRICETWSIGLNMVHLFETPTIRELGKVVEALIVKTYSLEYFVGLQKPNPISD